MSDLLYMVTPSGPVYKITIDDRNYVSWNVVLTSTLEKVPLADFDPAELKLFTNDVFTYDQETKSLNIVHSSLRLTDNIPGVLILADNKTYGREKKSDKKTQGKLLYKCVPDDIRLPPFLVPYEIKHLGFNKVYKNLYVTFQFKSWDSKHPYGTLNQNIGPVDQLENFYEYQLYCKSLNASIQKFNKDTIRVVKEMAAESDQFVDHIMRKNPDIEDRTSKTTTGNNKTGWHIFTIDPTNSLDFDDGFSIKKLNQDQTLVSIYIANVTIWLEELNLWHSFSKRISTIYLPDKKRPMLPTILSDCLCSLQQGAKRFAFVLDVIIDNKTSQIVSLHWKNALIKVFKNYRYEEPGLLDDADYNMLLETTRQLSRTYKYLNNVRNSHELVCYLMIFMNYWSAKRLLESRKGIFRSTLIKKELVLPQELPEDVNTFIKIWNSAAGQYVDVSSVDEELLTHMTRHDLLEIDAYIHITSPIRRLVDLLNMLMLQECVGLVPLSNSATRFYEQWISELDYINVTMRAIRKVQSDCNMLDMCYNQPETLEKIYDGYCFDKLVRNDGLYQFIVFLPELRLASRITLRDNIENFEKKQFKLYLFSDEEKFKKKIRLQLL